MFVKERRNDLIKILIFPINKHIKRWQKQNSMPNHSKVSLIRFKLYLLRNSKRKKKIIKAMDQKKFDEIWHGLSNKALEDSARAVLKSRIESGDLEAIDYAIHKLPKDKGAE